MPIRLRLTLAFALVMAIVLALTGFFLYTRLGSTLDGTIDDGLQAHAAAAAALVQQADHGLSSGRGRRVEPDQGFAQLLDAHGRIVDETSDLGDDPLIGPRQLARARRGQTLFGSTVDDTPVRLLALPVRAHGRSLVLVVGASLESRQSALAGLRRELLLGGPIALLLAALGGYALAAAALRPVERMRGRAAVISTSELGQRLPVPRRRDEISRLGETLNEMLARLEQGWERERSFVADASHELRTPLALLKTEIELALDEPHSAADLRAALRSAGEETDRLAALADDLLLLARADKGMLPLRREQLRVTDLFDTISVRYGQRAGGAGRRIEAERSPLTVLADRLQLEQALGNLVENGLRHGAGTLRLHAHAGAAGVELHVTDEGSGFADVFLGRAFERFSRADEARGGGGGSGLGLAIVAAIAHAHGGTARAANREGGGADVWLTLPRQEPSPPDRRSSALHVRAGTVAEEHREGR